MKYCEAGLEMQGIWHLRVVSFPFLCPSFPWYTVFKAEKSVEMWIKYRLLRLSLSLWCVPQKERETKTKGLRRRRTWWWGWELACSTFYGHPLLPLWIKQGNELSLIHPNKPCQFFIPQCTILPIVFYRWSSIKLVWIWSFLCWFWITFKFEFQSFKNSSTNVHYVPVERTQKKKKSLCFDIVQ